MCTEMQNTLNSQNNLEKEEQSWRHHALTSDHTAIKTVWYWQKIRHTGQWDRERSEINLHTCGQLNYDKEGRIYNGEETDSLISSVGKTRQPLVKEWN